jgi:hypothetical protein
MAACHTSVMLSRMCDHDSIDHALRTLTGRTLHDFRRRVMLMDEHHAA